MFAVALIGRSIARTAPLVAGVATLLAGFQVTLVLLASSYERAQTFERLALLAPSFLQRSLGPGLDALASFSGMVTFGYFHSVVTMTVVLLATYLGAEPAGDVETGMVDLILARPESRKRVERQVDVRGLLELGSRSTGYASYAFPGSCPLGQNILAAATSSWRVELSCEAVGPRPPRPLDSSLIRLRMALTSGTRLGPYEILSPLGASGMGEVYKAKDTRLHRTVAIKVLPEHLADSPERKARFEREAEAISQLNHPHICTLYDVGKHERIDFLVMEYIEGETLDGKVEERGCPFHLFIRARRS